MPMRERVLKCFKEDKTRKVAILQREQEDPYRDLLGRDSPEGLRLASVLIPVIERREGLTILFTKRAKHLPYHPGQVCFPGGKQQKNEGPQQAALRETYEETGIDSRYIQVLCCLDPYKTTTGFHITPYVGLLQPGFRVSASSEEVEELFEVPVAFLLQAHNYQREYKVVMGEKRLFYKVAFKSYTIWGATAEILVNFREILHNPSTRSVFCSK